MKNDFIHKIEMLLVLAILSGFFVMVSVPTFAFVYGLGYFFGWWPQ
jgi:hypothetical protein